MRYTFVVGCQNPLFKYFDFLPVKKGRKQEYRENNGGGK
jgi:hypothetical protein